MQLRRFKMSNKLLDFVITRLCISKIERNFMESGKEYGISKSDKKKLIKQFQNATKHIKSGTHWSYHAVLATEIFNISPEIKGDVIECGCWKGASSSSLSLVCEKVGRKLIVCDSFEGLPEHHKETHHYSHLKKYSTYREGMFAGKLDEVKSNITKYGNIESCEFLKGWFNKSLKSLKDPIVFGFFDVDLWESMYDCVKHVWPLLVDNGLIYTDDSCDLDVVSVWFDEDMWLEILGQHAPGYVGSGCGLPILPNFTSLGYSRKVLDIKKSFDNVEWKD